MINLVKQYSEEIDSSRTEKTVFKYMLLEVEELREEIYGTEEGEDGVIGEAIDVIACLLDIIIQHNPSITQEEIDVILEKKLQKWVRNHKLKKYG